MVVDLQAWSTACSAFGNQKSGDTVARRHGERSAGSFITNIILFHKMLVLPPTPHPFFFKPETWAREFTMSWRELRLNLVTLSNLGWDKKYCILA